MKTEDFQVMSAELEKQTPHQRSLLVDRLHKIEHVQAVSTLVESRVLSTPLCPTSAVTITLRDGVRLPASILMIPAFVMVVMTFS